MKKSLHKRYGSIPHKHKRLDRIWLCKIYSSHTKYRFYKDSLMLIYIFLLIFIPTILSYLILKFIYRIIFKSQKKVSKFLIFLGSIGLIIFYYTPYSYYLEPSYWQFRNMCKISPVVIMQANRSSTSMDRRKEGLNNLRIDDTKDTGAPAQDSEVIISIFNPHREKLTSYRGYDIKALQQNFRVITVLKNRYGEADVEVGCAFYGRTGLFAELPRPEEIYDYEKYSNSDWLLDVEDKIENEDDVQITQKSKFIL